MKMLHIASALGYQDIVELLLSIPGVRIAMMNRNIQTPAIVALTPEIRTLINKTEGQRAALKKFHGKTVKRTKRVNRKTYRKRTLK